MSKEPLAFQQETEPVSKLLKMVVKCNIQTALLVVAVVGLTFTETASGLKMFSMNNNKGNGMYRSFATMARGTVAGPPPKSFGDFKFNPKAAPKCLAVASEKKAEEKPKPAAKEQEPAFMAAEQPQQEFVETPSSIDEEQHSSVPAQAAAEVDNDFAEFQCEHEWVTKEGMALAKGFTNSAEFNQEFANFQAANEGAMRAAFFDFVEKDVIGNIPAGPMLLAFVKAYQNTIEEDVWSDQILRGHFKPFEAHSSRKFPSLDDIITADHDKVESKLKDLHDKLADEKSCNRKSLKEILTKMRTIGRNTVWEEVKSEQAAFGHMAGYLAARTLQLTLTREEYHAHCESFCANPASLLGA